MLAGRINDAVEGRLRQQHQGLPTLYRRELGICVGAARIDVAAVNGAITGCEVKSGSDGLGRLDRQVAHYGQVVDLAVLVVERAHPDRVAEMVPSWWGVWHAAEDGPQAVHLEVIRHPTTNGHVEPFAVAQLLWRDEALDVLRARQLHRGRSSLTRWQLWRCLADEMPLDELQLEVRSRLRARQDW